MGGGRAPHFARKCGACGRGGTCEPARAADECPRQVWATKCGTRCGACTCTRDSQAWLLQYNVLRCCLAARGMQDVRPGHAALAANRGCLHPVQVHYKPSINTAVQRRPVMVYIPSCCIAPAIALTHCRYTVEQLKGGLKTTALYKPLPSHAPAPGDPEPYPGSSDQAAPASGSAPAASATPGPRDVAVDVNGVPKRRSGVSLAPWLRWGSLLSFDSPMAMHALQVGLISAGAV